jgi:hypothetical protein
MSATEAAPPRIRRIPNTPPPRDDEEGTPSGQSEPAFSRGTILTRSQLADLPRIQPMVDGVLSYPAAAVVVGAYGLGKSVLVLGLAASVATGERWLGHEVQRRRVLIVVGEGANGLDDRMAAWEYAWAAGKPIPDEDLEFLVKPNTLTNVATWSEITAYAVDGGFGMVILDTFSSLAPDADETKDAALIMRRLSDLSAEINGAAILVHHPGWSDNTRTRGGYQFEANADEVLVLTGVAEGSDLVALTRKKVKDGPTGQVLWLRRLQVLNSVIMESARADDMGVPLRERILAALAAYGEIGATGPQLSAEMGVESSGRSGFYKALQGLVKEDLTATTGAHKSMRYYLPEHAPEVGQ